MSSLLGEGHDWMGYRPDPPPEQNSLLAALLALLHSQHPAQHPAQPPLPPRHYGPPEGPLGENAHAGWGQNPSPPTTASSRRAAPTRSKLGGVIPPPANFAGSAHSRGPVGLHGTRFFLDGHHIIPGTPGEPPPFHRRPHPPNLAALIRAMNDPTQWHYL